MVDPVTAFKTKAVKLIVGDVHVYHVGHLASDAASSPSLTQIAMFAHGLHLMGRVSLKQFPVRNVVGTLHGEVLPRATHYEFKVLAPIGPVDFDVARKVHLESLAS